MSRSKRQSGLGGYTNAEAAQCSGEYVSFSFGQNWLKFAESLREEQIEAAERSFTKFTRVQTLEGHTFLDAGCGSGLSSLVALRLGADKVISFDIDPYSVDCTQRLRARYGWPESKWQVLTCSLLDHDELNGIGPVTFVYCWGTVHHTGRMWKAIDNIANCVSPGGMLFLSVYNETKHSRKWLVIKRVYNKSPWALKKVIQLSLHCFVFLRWGNHKRFVREYRRNRGMTYFRDVEDWLGGLPYEYASVEKVREYLDSKGFDLIRLKSTCSHGCNEFLFMKLSSSRVR